MTDVSYQPTQPLPTPPAPVAETPAPAPAPHHSMHHVTTEGVVLIVVAALLFGALAFATGWFGGSMHARFAGRQGYAIGRLYRPGMMGGYQQDGQGQGYGYGYGYGRGGMMRQWQNQQGYQQNQSSTPDQQSQQYPNQQLPQGAPTNP